MVVCRTTPYVNSTNALREPNACKISRVNGYISLYDRLWLVMHCACSLWFSFVGLTAAHHHPDIYHEGDAMRDNPDWGLCQLDAVRDRQV